MDKLKGKNVLVVDDEDEIRFNIRYFLEHDSLNVFEASNGLDALDVCKKEKIDLVVSDIKMPEMNGIEMAKKLNEFDPTIPVIIITGFGDSKLAVDALRIGVFEFISKPFTREFVVNRVQKALQMKVLRDAENAILRQLEEALGIDHSQDVSKLDFEDRIKYLDELATILTIKFESINQR